MQSMAALKGNNEMMFMSASEEDQWNTVDVCSLRRIKEYSPGVILKENN